MDVGDLRVFAKNLGRWLYRVNPELKDEKLKAALKQFAKTAPIPIGVGEGSSSLSFDEFVEEAARGYAPGEEASEW
jgi:hypothetical protein